MGRSRAAIVRKESARAAYLKGTQLNQSNLYAQ